MARRASFVRPRLEAPALLLPGTRVLEAQDAFGIVEHEHKGNSAVQRVETPARQTIEGSLLGEAPKSLILDDPPLPIEPPNAMRVRRARERRHIVEARPLLSGLVAPAPALEVILVGDDGVELAHDPALPVV